MRTGVLQQVAPPQVLYDSPVNLFVAGFIGSPSMNFMSGALEEGKLRTALGDIPIQGQLQRDLEGSDVGRLCSFKRLLIGSPSIQPPAVGGFLF